MDKDLDRLFLESQQLLYELNNWTLYSIDAMMPGDKFRKMDNLGDELLFGILRLA